MRFYSGKNVLVTGSSGLLGSHLMDFLLNSSANLRVLTRRPLAKLGNTVNILGDINDPSVVKNALKDVDIVFHLAALVNVDTSIKDPYTAMQTNFMATLQLLELARKQKNPPHIIFSSSTSIYCIPHGEEKITEGSPIISSTPYSTSKAAADLLCQTYVKTYNLPITILRASTIYGPRQKRTQFIPTVISQGLSKKILELGPLNAYRDFCYVKDAAIAFILAGATSDVFFEILNITAGYSTSLTEIVRKVSTLLKKDLSVASRPTNRPAEEFIPFIIDSSKAKRLLGWKPCYDLDSGLKETIDWFTYAQ